MIKEAYEAGYQHALEKLSKSNTQDLVSTMSRGENQATAMGGVPLAGPLLAAAAANRGEKAKAGAGSAAGQLAGAFVPGKLKLPAIMAGGALGARLGHKDFKTKGSR